MFLPVELKRGTKMLQFDVCCEAIDQNIDCGCVLKNRYTNLQSLANPNRQITIQKLMA